MNNTNIFQKLPDFYYSQSECKLHNRKKTNTNSRYSHYNQTHFTAGDEQQFETYRMNTFDENTQLADRNIICDDKWVSYVDKINYFEKFKNLNNKSVDNTFQYLFHKFKKGIFIKIQNNELKVFLPFSKNNYTNEWSDMMTIDKKFKNFHDLFSYTQDKCGYKFDKRKVNSFPNTWYNNNCIFRYEWPVSEGDSGSVQMKNMFEELCKNRNVPDIEFFINRRDYPLMTNNETEAYKYIFGPRRKLISHNYTSYSPIFSMSSRDNYADIAIPTWEDWDRVSSIDDNKFFPKACRDYRETFDIQWELKKNIAVFRGGTTGCGTTTRDNMRLKVSDMSHKGMSYNGKTILDAGITSFNIRPRIKPLKPSKQFPNGRSQLTTIITENLKFKKASHLTPKQQSEYKYIINIDGHSSAYRLSYELSFGSVILLVDSKYYLWFRKMLVPYEHYVPVDDKLNNLEQQIKWCIDNDDKCKKIAQNARKFYDLYLSKDSIFNYLQCLLVRTKKEIGNYIYLPDLHNFQTQKKLDYINKSIPFLNDYKNIELDANNITPLVNHDYNLLQGISNVIQNQFNQNISIDKSGISINKVIKETKNVKIYNSDFLNLKNILAVKQVKNNDKRIIDELLHHTFVGKNCINKLRCKIPNFNFTYGLDTQSNILIMENINTITFDDWLKHKKLFNFQDYYIILLQISLSLHMAQKECGFIHYDLLPWNIMIQTLKKEKTIKYQINNCDFVEIKTRIVPIIIDYGKSHVIYKNTHYSMNNRYDNLPIQDILSIFVSSINIIAVKQQISNKDEFIRFSNFLSDTEYSDVFTSLGQIKSFTKKMKKYTELVNEENTKSLKHLTCLDFMKFIETFYTQKLNYSKNYYEKHLNYRQVSEFIYAKNNTQRKSSFQKVFYRIKRSSIPRSDNLLIINYIWYNLLHQMKQNFENYLINKFPITDIEHIYNNCKDFVNNIYKNTGSLKKFDTNINTFKFQVLDENLFINLNSINNTIQTFNNNLNIYNIKTIKDIISYSLCIPQIVVSSDFKDFYNENLKNIIDTSEYKSLINNANIYTFIQLSKVNANYVKNILEQKESSEDSQKYISLCNQILEKINKIII